MNPYITFRELNKGQLEYYILQRAFPNFVGRIVTYPIEGAIVNVPVAGYNLWVTFAGTIQGNMIPAYKQIGNEILATYENMALWFVSERVTGSTRRFEKFKIKT